MGRPPSQMSPTKRINEYTWPDLGIQSITVTTMLIEGINSFYAIRFFSALMAIDCLNFMN